MVPKGTPLKSVTGRAPSTLPPVVAVVPVALSLFTGIDLHKVSRLALELDPAGIVTAFVDSVSVLKR